MLNIWHIWHTKHENETLSDVPNLKNYVTLLQYRLMQQWQNGILLFYCVFLSPLPQISLSLSTLSYFFSLCHSLSLPSPPCSRKLLKITLKKVATDLASPRCWSRFLMLQFWLIWWVLGLWLGWGCGLRPDHGSCLRLGFDLDWGSGLSFDGLISVRRESRWLCCVCGCGWEVEEEGWWWLDCGVFFFFGWGWWLLVEKWRKRKVVGAWIVFFFLLPIVVVCGYGWWGNGGSGCCDGLVLFFFNFLFCWGFWIWNLLVLLVLLIDVDVVVVVDDNGEKIIYYFNV